MVVLLYIVDRLHRCTKHHVRLPEYQRCKIRDSNVTGNLINIMRGINLNNGEKPEDVSDWHKQAGFIFSTQNPGIFAVMDVRKPHAICSYSRAVYEGIVVMSHNYWSPTGYGTRRSDHVSITPKLSSQHSNTP